MKYGMIDQLWGETPRKNLNQPLHLLPEPGVPKKTGMQENLKAGVLLAGRDGAGEQSAGYQSERKRSLKPGTGNVNIRQCSRKHSWLPGHTDISREAA